MKIPLVKNFIILLFVLATFTTKAQQIERDSVVSLVAQAGRAYQALDTKKSLQYAQKALNHAYEINDNLLIARIYNILGLNYTEYSEHKKAEEAFLKGLAALENTNDIVVRSWIETNIANLYQVNFKDYDKAISYHLKSLENSKKLNSEYDILLSIINIGILYIDKQDYDTGYTYIKEAEKYLLNVNEPGIFITYNSLNALYHEHKKEYDKAESFYLEALKYCKADILDLNAAHTAGLYESMALFYANRGDKSKGYDYLQKHITLKDSIYSKERADAIANYSNQIDLDLYKREIIKIEKLNDQQQKTIFYSKIVGGLLIFIAINLLVFIVLLSRNQKQKNKLITQIETKNLELEMAKAKAEELSELKSQFISNVSHELRTPLYGVIGLTKILEQDYPILKGNKVIQALNFSADYLMNLINDLLQLQKIEGKTVTLESNPYSISHEIKNIVASLSVIAHKNKNTISIIEDNYIADIVELDKLKLNQILYNLISNALKFTTDGEVKIYIKQTKSANKKIELEYKIQDTGCGISKENLEVVFEKFAQFYAKGSDYQGTGLGLPIVKQLIEIFNGKIQVESELNVGTTFTFSLPCSEYTKSEIIETSKIAVDFSNLHINILLIENNEINRIVIQRNFENHNIPCTIVSSAREALQLLKTNDFAIILTDINMPEINGFKFAEIARQRGINVPIIALTAYSKQDIENEIIEAKIQEVVTKPYDFNHLLRVIHKYVVTK